MMLYRYLLRLFPCVEYLISIAVLIVCFRLNQSDWTTNPQQSSWVSRSRSIIQIIISIIASIFGWRQVSGMLKLINLYYRRKFCTDPFPLHALAGAHALSTKTWGVGLPHIVRAGVLGLVVVEIVIASLFVAVLTPVTAEQKVLKQNISLPFYSNDPNGELYNRTWNPFADPAVARNALGSFSWVPGKAFAGPLLRTLATATNVNGSARVHQKDDASQYSYYGRSYGVGASVGLYAPIQRNTSASHSSYQESGYVTNVSCIINQTSAWVINLAEETSDWTYPDLFLCEGYLPITAPNPDLYTSASLVPQAELCHVLARCSGGSCMIGVAARSYKSRVASITPNSMLDKIQCGVKFTPSMFDITTDHNQQQVTVNPRPDLPVQDIDPTTIQYGQSHGRIQEWTMWQLTLLSMIQTTLYTSLYGDALVQNVYNYQDAHRRTRAVINSNDLIGAAQDSFAAIIDDVLLYLSSAMLVLGPQQGKTPLQVTFNAYKLGDSRFGYAALALSIIPLIVYIIFSIPLIRAPIDWNIESISDIVKASYLGGIQKGQDMRMMYPTDMAQTAREIVHTHCTLNKTDHGYCLSPATTTVSDLPTASLLYHVYHPEVYPLTNLR